MQTSISQIFTSIECVNHKKQIEFINLTYPLRKNQSRLLCKDCDFNHCENIFETNVVNDFLEKIQIQQQQLQNKFDKNQNLFRQLKDSINDYLNSIEELLFQEKQNIQNNQVIKPGNSFDQFLKQNQINRELIKNMSDELCALILQDQNSLKLHSEQVNFNEEGLMKVKQKIEKLTKFEQFMNQGESQINQQFLQSQSQLQIQQSIVSTTQSFVKTQVNYVKTYEKQIDQQIIYDLKFNNKGNIFVIASNLIADANCYAQIYFQQDGIFILKQNLDIHSGYVSSICFNSQDDNFFTACQDKKIRFWKQTKQNKWSLEQELIELNSTADCILMNNQQNYLAAGGEYLCFWKQVNGKWIYDTQQNNFGQKIETLSFNESDKLLAVAYQDYLIKIFEYYNEKWIQRLQIQKYTMLLNFYNLNDLIGIQINGYLNFYEYDNQICDYQISEIELKQQKENYVACFCLKKKLLALSQKGKEPIDLFMVNENRVSKVLQQIPCQGNQLFFSNNGDYLAIISNKQLIIYQDEGERY
ncbi:unnamed protein product [Paramecium sonneborni]|uniref:Anaphase-promoting complex subunit 4-like WD40 domain-containing protein n=1 Tax=Paramecium sonneborni TaxID=65129 RepID=A0A8S1MJP3_9CILI|nr:unnamed protein product [Paramecium sonneborni]